MVSQKRTPLKGYCVQQLAPLQYWFLIFSGFVNTNFQFSLRKYHTNFSLSKRHLANNSIQFKKIAGLEIADWTKLSNQMIFVLSWVVFAIILMTYKKQRVVDGIESS